MTSIAEASAELSVAQKVARLTPEQRAAWVAQLDEQVLAEVARREWWFVARPQQQEPEGDWRIWLVLAGRGWGKTATGAEWLIDQMLAHPIDTNGRPTEWGAFGETYEDCRNLMIEGPSGLRQALRRRGIRYHYVTSPIPRMRLESGQRIHFQGAADGDVGRGLNLAGAWLDELGKWPKAWLSWTEGLSPALRTRTPSGGRPRVIVTTTPKPLKILVDWSKRTDASVFVTRGSTFDNAANLSPDTLAELLAQYTGPGGVMSRTGRQELFGELLTEVDGALWKQSWINDKRVARKDVPQLTSVVVAIDPAVSDSPDSDETGLVAVGRGEDGEDYVLADASGKFVGIEAARKAWLLWLEVEGDLLVYESNQGMDWVRDVLRSAWDELKADGLVEGNPPMKGIQAMRGKRLRAEPVAGRYELGRVHHVGAFEHLERQMTEWLPSSGTSPDRLDALVHGLQAVRQGETFDATVSAPQETVAGQAVDPVAAAAAAGALPFLLPGQKLPRGLR